MMPGNQSFFSRHDQLINRIVDYRCRNNSPEMEMKCTVDDNRTLKLLEERVNELTVAMENMRKTLDRFVTLYESEKSQFLAERQEVEKLTKAAAENREKEMDIKVVAMHMEMDALRTDCKLNKQRWEQERDQMQKKLEYYKSLSQKGPTDSSSAQKTGLFNAVSKQHQDKGWDRNPDNAGTTVARKTPFAHRTNYVRPNVWDYHVVALRRKDKCTTIKKAIIQKHAESQQSQENAEPEERCEQKSEQKVPEPVVAQSERVIEPSSIAPRAVPESTASMTSPPAAHSTENHSNPNARRLLMSLLEEHYCGNSECLVLEFRNCMQHATKCAIGSQCNWFICMCEHVMAEHLKVICVQSQCAFCQGPKIVNEDKVREIVMMLKKYCFINSVSSENESARKAAIYMAARAAVKYGLVNNGEKSHCEDTTDDESSSSSSDEEESSEEEKTSEEWEMIES